MTHLPIPEAQRSDEKQFVDISNNYTLLRYFQQVHTQFMCADNFGLALDDDDRGSRGKRIFFEKLFVTPHLSPDYRSPEQVIKAEEKKRYLRSGVSNTFEAHPRMFILGDPGSGKSTLISWVMLRFGSYGENQMRYALGEMVPFPLILRELSLDAVQGWDDLWRIFLDSGGELTQALKSDPDIIEQIFVSGQALVLLDGLDEVTHPRLRNRLGQAVLEAMTRYPRSRFVITLRVVGFNQQEIFSAIEPENDPDNDPAEASARAKAASLVSSADPISLFEKERLLTAETMSGAREKTEIFPVIYLAPFNRDQQKWFVQNWYQQYVPKNAAYQEQVSALIQRVSHNDGLGRLARIPVMLNMICFIHSRRGRLPDGRAELYLRIAETYLTGLDRARGLKFQGRELSFDYYDLSEWLGQLALEMQEQRTESNSTILISVSKVKSFFQEGLENKGFQAAEAEKETGFILAYLAQRSGMFIPRGRNAANEEQYAFSHLSFLEYFAASELKIQAQFWQKKEWKALRKKSNLPWWGETLMLFFEQLENSRLASQTVSRLFGEKGNCLLSNDIKNAPAWSVLAEIIMDTSVRFPVKLRKEWITAIWAFFLNHPNYEIKRNSFERICNLLWTHQFDSLSAFSQQAQLLTHIRLGGKRIMDISPLANLTELLLLILSNTSVNDVSPLANLSELQVLVLNNISVSDVSPLANLSKLQLLWLDNTSVSDVSPLANLSKLQKLWLNGTSVSDVSPLANLSELQELGLNNASVSDVSPLANLSELQELWLNNTSVSDVSPLANLSELRDLWLSNTSVSDVSMLKQENLRIHGVNDG